MDFLQVPLRYHTMAKVVNPKYDSIVDRTDFKKGQDRERAMRLAGDTGGSTTQGVYDFPDGKFIVEKAPSDVELALRSGRLDKADIDTLSRIQKEAAKKELDDKKAQKLEDEKKAIDDARQAYLDSKTGFNSQENKE